MKENLSRVVQVCCLAVATFTFCSRANAVALTVNYPNYPNLSIVLPLGGTPLPGENSIADNMMISGTGPMYNPDNGDGWEATAVGTVTDNLGDGSSVFVYVCSGFSCHPFDGSAFSFTSVPTFLQIDLNVGVPYDVGGPVNADASMNLFLPDGMYVTPLPTALPLFASGLGVLSLLGWRRKKKTAALAA